MQDDFRILFPFNLHSASAVNAARRYVNLIEAQLSQAHSDERSEGLARFHTLPDPDEQDYEEHVWSVDRAYEDDFWPITRFTSVVYLYMLFETYVTRHIREIQRLLDGDVEILRALQKQNKRGIVNAAQTYFKDHANLAFFTADQWLQLQEIAHLRHCIIHHAGIARDYQNRESIYSLENRNWHGQKVGIEVDRYKERDLGGPVQIEQRFLEYCLSVLEHFFHTLGTAADAKFPR